MYEYVSVRLCACVWVGKRISACECVFARVNMYVCILNFRSMILMFAAWKSLRISRGKKRCVCDAHLKKILIPIWINVIVIRWYIIDHSIQFIPHFALFLVRYHVQKNESILFMPIIIFSNWKNKQTKFEIKKAEADVSIKNFLRTNLTTTNWRE